jgi:hypothetical protein
MTAMQTPATRSNPAVRPGGFPCCAGLLAAALAILPLAAGADGADSVAGADDGTRMTLRHEPRMILEAVARSMNVTLRADEPLPAIHFESRTSLARFQDAVAPQWRFRPPMMANVYVVARNEIYLIDDPTYYRRMRRTLDESLAHEYAHYLQVRYFGADLSDESCETGAVAAQFAFRERYLEPAAAARTG